MLEAKLKLCIALGVEFEFCIAFNLRDNWNFNYLVEILIHQDLYFNDIVYIYIFFFLLIDYFNKGVSKILFMILFRVIKFRLSRCILFYLISAMILRFCQHWRPILSFMITFISGKIVQWNYACPLKVISLKLVDNEFVHVVNFPFLTLSKFFFLFIFLQIVELLILCS